MGTFRREAIIVGVTVLLLLLLVGLAAVRSGTANQVGTPDVCPELDSGKIDTVGDPATVTMTAPPGNVITRYCIKAGSVQSGAGTEFFDVDPPQESITVGHTSGKAVSHYSFEYGPTVRRETTTTGPTTTVVDTTTTIVETTTTAPTTTVVETTTTAPTTTVVDTTTTVVETTTTLGDPCIPDDPDNWCYDPPPSTLVETS